MAAPDKKPSISKQDNSVIDSSKRVSELDDKNVKLQVKTAGLPTLKIQNNGAEERGSRSGLFKIAPPQKIADLDRVTKNTSENRAELN